MQSSVVLLWTRLWTSGFRKTREISWLAEWLLASREGLCSAKLVMEYAVVGIYLTNMFLQRAKLKEMCLKKQGIKEIWNKEKIL